jgi:hypothetical protein
MTCSVSPYLSITAYFPASHFHPEDGGNMYLQNVDVYIPDYSWHNLDHNMNIRSDIDSTENVGDKKNINLLSFAPK